MGNWSPFTFVTEFWKITHMGACEIIIFDGLLLRAEHTFKNISCLELRML